MATSLLSPLSSPSIEPPALTSSHPKSSFIPNPKLLFSTPFSRTKRCVQRCSKYYNSPSAKSVNHIPKQFREENLQDGLMDNYKNVPRHLYGLTPSQMDMFMTEENPVCRQAASVTEETISSAHHYLNNGGMWSLSGMSDRGPSKYSMSVSMYRGGGGVYDMPQSAPPDLPSLLLDARIVYLGMPIVSAVTELLIAQFMWLDFDNASKPIYLYINSSGTQNEKKESVGAETDAYAIADAMAVTKLYLPVVGRSSGPVTDMWRKAKDLEANAESYIELLAKGTGKPKEEIAKDIQRPKYMQAKEAIVYGLADKIIDSQDAAYEKRDYDMMLAQQMSMEREAGGPQAAPSGFR
ncbi:ATP-dependent clp protease proteolytic subunit-related protein 1 [Citrus sinensis]|nr:ATP-dependent clp protease proteolytic subunit-related protein 1 [Citrus sinensis]